MPEQTCLPPRHPRWAGTLAWLLLALGLGWPGRSRAQLFTSRNYVVLAPDAAPDAIVRQAARLGPSARQLRWQQLEVTGFLHFGLNTFTNREWGDGRESPALFNPSGFDAGQWVRACRAGGIRQVILTAKHHDGFCLWPSRYTAHSVQHSPWRGGRGDVVREVAVACRRQRVGFGIYLSPWDRHCPFFGDSARYNDYFVNQLTELLTHYGRIDEVWLDGANGEGPTGRRQVYDFARWYALIRRLQPTAVIAVMGPDVRWVGTESGYGRLTEWSVLPLAAQDLGQTAARSQHAAAFTPQNRLGDDLGSRAQLQGARALVWYPAEVDVSIRPGWFYHPAENRQVKTPAQLLDIYYSSVGRNGVLLLNVPPTRAGRLAAPDCHSLRAWHQTLKRTFARNLLREAQYHGPGTHQARAALLDGKYDTYWAAPAGDTTAVLDFTFARPRTFDVLLLQENIRVGQRIERFRLEYEVAGTWRTAAAGTTVGYKRLLRFAPLRARHLRLRIEAARLAPTLAAVGIYRQAALPPAAHQLPLRP